jgi:hypothetical protein
VGAVVGCFNGCGRTGTTEAYDDDVE